MARKDLSDPDKFALWIKSGGICAIRGCDEELIFQMGGINVNVSNAAHIISHSDNGPRSEYKSEYGITEFNVDNEPNLMLTCLKHHKIIDANGTKDQYSPELLYEMKNEHESWVRNLLKKRNNSIAFLHKTKGGPIDEIILSKELNTFLIASIQFQEEFTDFTSEGWLKGKENNEELLKKFRSITSQYPGTRIEMFPLSHIPLLIHIGSLITNTTPVTVYQYDRNAMQWVLSSPEQKSVEELDVAVNISENEKSKILVVKIGVSGKIHLSDVELVIPDTIYDLLDISISDPRTDRVLFYEEVIKIKNLFDINVQRLKIEHDYKQLHLFYAGPAGLAVELGRCINTSMWPAVHLYNYENRNDPKYQFTFDI